MLLNLVPYDLYSTWCHEWAQLPDWQENPVRSFRWGQYFINQAAKHGIKINDPALYYAPDPYYADSIILHIYVNERKD